MSTHSGGLSAYDYTDLRTIHGPSDFATRIERREFQAARDKAVVEIQKALDYENAANSENGE